MSPYNYCVNNPIRFVDPDGRDGMVTGRGTKDDPYVITANYYYQNGSLNPDQKRGLNRAITAYNNAGRKGVTEIKNDDGSTSYVKFNLTAKGVDNVREAIDGDIFADGEGGSISFGNRVGIESNDMDELGSANGWGIYLNEENISGFVKEGADLSRTITSTFIHEIGHNLGLDHNDRTNIMKQSNITHYQSQIGESRTSHDYPSVDRSGIQIMVQRINMPRVGSLGIIVKKQ